MPKPAKGKSKKKASRKPAHRKTAKKKTIKKKVTAKKKTAGKKPAKKKTAKKKTAVKKKAKKAPAKAARKTAIPKKVVTVEPGPQPSGIPSVEEPAANEEAIGTVTHYYSHLAVAVMQVNKGTIKTGDTIHVKGHTTDFSQQIESMEYEHQHVDQASAGQSVGLKVKDHAREHDIVYLVK
jgi:hypothetical protein